MQCNCSGVRFTLGPHVSKTMLGNWIITHIFSPIFIYVWPLFAHSDLLTSNTILTKACDPFHPRVCILLSTTVHLHNLKQANLMLLEYCPSIIPSALSVVTRFACITSLKPRMHLVFFSTCSVSVWAGRNENIGTVKPDTCLKLSFCTHSENSD